MDSLPSKMDEADQHLDRLGGILRSIRASTPDRSIPSNTVGRKPIRQRQHQQQRGWQQQQQQQQQQYHEQEERRLLCASGSSRLRTASQPSQTETMAMAPLLHASQREEEAGRRPLHKRTPAPQRQRLGDNNEDSRTASSVRGPSAPSSTVPSVVQPGNADAETGRGGGGDEVATKAPLSSLRGGAVRAWWRGLSCGVCFAAGAWAREGHAVYGVVLALVAVCGETMLYHVA